MELFTQEVNVYILIEMNNWERVQPLSLITNHQLSCILLEFHKKNHDKVVHYCEMKRIWHSFININSGKCGVHFYQAPFSTKDVGVLNPVPNWVCKRISVGQWLFGSLGYS